MSDEKMSDEKIPLEVDPQVDRLDTRPNPNLLSSFVTWINKGGVGKTSLTFHTACQIAKLRPECRILVIDMCPQANVTQSLLGGGGIGQDLLFARCQTLVTIAGYINSSMDQPQPVDMGPYCLNVSARNTKIPTNLWLLPGDPYLDLMSAILNQRVSLTAAMNQESPEKKILLMIRRGIESLVQTYGGQWIIMVDTNPAFTVYTQMAIVSCRQLIVPMNADDYSMTGIQAMCALLYGSNHRWDYLSLHQKATVYGIILPKIRLLVANRSTTFDSRPAKAYITIARENALVIHSEFQGRQTTPFHPHGRLPAHQSQQPPTNFDEFKARYLMDVRDFNSCGVLAIYHGIPMFAMNTSKLLDTSLKSEQVNNSKQAIAELAGALLLHEDPVVNIQA